MWKFANVKPTLCLADLTIDLGVAILFYTHKILFFSLKLTTK